MAIKHISFSSSFVVLRASSLQAHNLLNSPFYLTYGRTGGPTCTLICRSDQWTFTNHHDELILGIPAARQLLARYRKYKTTIAHDDVPRRNGLQYQLVIQGLQPQLTLFQRGVSFFLSDLAGEKKKLASIGVNWRE